MSACRYGRGRPADRVGVGALTCTNPACRSGCVSPPTCPHPARRLRRRPRVTTLSALLAETLRLTCIKVRRRVARSTAESCLKHGGESERGGRRTVRTRSEGLSDLTKGVPSFVSRPSAGKHTTPLAISVCRLARLGLPTHTYSAYRLCRRSRATARTAAAVHFKWA